MQFRVKKLAFAGFMLLGAFVLLTFAYLRFGVAIPCVFHRVTGLYCPGCGTMRALVSLTQMQIARAIRYNAFLLVLLPLLAVKGFQTAVFYLKSGASPAEGGKEQTLWITVTVLFVVFGILRNLPALSFLAPI